MTIVTNVFSGKAPVHLTLVDVADSEDLILIIFAYIQGLEDTEDLICLKTH